MAMEIIESGRPSRYSFPTISLYVKMKRFVFNSESYELLKSLLGKDVEYVEVYKETENPNIFYIKPCNHQTPNARKLGKSSKRGRFFDGKTVLVRLGWREQTPMTLRVVLDRAANVLIVDKTKPAQLPEQKKRVIKRIGGRYD